MNLRFLRLGNLDIRPLSAVLSQAYAWLEGKRRNPGASRQDRDRAEVTRHRGSRCCGRRPIAVFGEQRSESASFTQAFCSRRFPMKAPSSGSRGYELGPVRGSPLGAGRRETWHWRHRSSERNEVLRIRSRGRSRVCTSATPFVDAGSVAAFRLLRSRRIKLSEAWRAGAAGTARSLRLACS